MLNELIPNDQKIRFSHILWSPGIEPGSSLTEKLFHIELRPCIDTI